MTIFKLEKINRLQEAIGNQRTHESFHRSIAGAKLTACTILKASGIPGYGISDWTITYNRDGLMILWTREEYNCQNYWYITEIPVQD